MTDDIALKTLESMVAGQGKNISMDTRGAGSPKLAVIVTCWNYADYVTDAIESVLRQGRRDCELVVIDDGSTDNSWDEICRTGVRAYHIENAGQRLACLRGLQETTAPFVLFLDADDELLPGALTEVLWHLDKDVAKLQFPLLRMDARRRIMSGPVPPLSDFRERELLVREVLKTGYYTSPPTSGNVFRRDVCQLIEGADYERAVDGVILFVAPFMGDIISLSRPLGLYRVHDRNDSGFSSELNPIPLKREAERFEHRLEHLRSLLDKTGLGSRLVTANRAYFHQERSFYLAIANSARVGLRQLLFLLSLLWTYPYSAKVKLSMTVFFALTFMLSSERAKRVINYRLQAHSRSAMGLIRAIFRR
ncbi:MULTISPECIES: glycosyltransferase family A protein [Rhizobium/Agrobacterium group]|jgi:glycosyltransferase involved in cell wall biosynthesis|uniref:glycosyltransferase family 2 protein n=1 Tax=Rhizobium/Agrobacterium group TaxID=227290 RepID=UPI00257006B0|nr:glycosyltransferase family A protein [Agrobacterium sp. Ap1]